MINFAHKNDDEAHIAPILKAKTNELFNERRWVEGKVINCNNNCENILSILLRFLPSRHTFKFFPSLLAFARRSRQISGTFPFCFSSLCFHQSTNENMCAFLLPIEIFFFAAHRSRSEEKPRNVKMKD